MKDMYDRKPMLSFKITSHSFAAVFRLVTQRSSASLKTAAKETNLQLHDKKLFISIIICLAHLIFIRPRR